VGLCAKARTSPRSTTRRSALGVAARGRQSARSCRPTRSEYDIFPT
jgi:hypothetical protein